MEVWPLDRAAGQPDEQQLDRHAGHDRAGREEDVAVLIADEERRDRQEVDQRPGGAAHQPPAPTPGSFSRESEAELMQ